MKQLLFIISLILTKCSFGQKIDTIIHAPNYTSYYSYQLHEPIFVTYSLFKGGGTCSRDKDRFITDNLPNSATAKDYEGSGFDEGHECNSKDFAYDCKLQEQTFRFYNCVPQTPRLNRGIWKQWETTIRKESQHDTIQIICGNIFGSKTIGNHIAVPSYCWKVTKVHDKIIHCLLFPNDNSNTYRTVKVDSLRSIYKCVVPF